MKTCGYRLSKEAYLGGLWGSAHCLWAGGAIVGGLLAVVLCPGGAVVGLASGLGGSGGCCGLRCGLTLEAKQISERLLRVCHPPPPPGSAHPDVNFWQLQGDNIYIFLLSLTRKVCEMGNEPTTGAQSGGTETLDCSRAAAGATTLLK